MNTKTSAWALCEPARGAPWDLAKVAPLHRRAGFGAARLELERDLKDRPKASVERLLKPPGATASEKELLDVLKNGVLDARDEERLKSWWLYRMLFDADRLREKLTLFWHGPFATSNRNVQNVPLMLA